MKPIKKPLISRCLTPEQSAKAAEVMLHYSKGGRVYQRTCHAYRGKKLPEYRESEHVTWNWGRLDYRAAYDVETAANGTLLDASW